jgi:hypothetical protein
MFGLAIGYMQMTEAQVEEYDDDPNQWVPFLFPLLF